MKATITIVLLVGLPGSAKSTLCRWIVRELTDEFNEAIHLEYDQIVKDSLNSSQQQYDDTRDYSTLSLNEATLDAWRQSRSIALQQLHQSIQNVMISLLMDTISSSNEYHVLILLDDNFHLRSMRRNVYKSCVHFLDTSCPLYSELQQSNIYLSLHFATLYLDIPVADCLQRNALRVGQDRVPDHVILNMASKLDCDSFLQQQQQQQQQSTRIQKWASFEHHCLILNQEDIVHLLHESHPSALKPKLHDFLQKSRTIIAMDFDFILSQRQSQQVIPEEESQSVLHTCDLCLRFLVGVTCRQDKRFASFANATRKQMLEILKFDWNNGTLQDDMDEDLYISIFHTYVSLFTSSLSSSTHNHLKLEHNTENSTNDDEAALSLEISNLVRVLKQEYDHKISQD